MISFELGIFTAVALQKTNMASWNITFSNTIYVFIDGCCFIVMSVFWVV